LIVGILGQATDANEVHAVRHPMRLKDVVPRSLADSARLV